MFVIIEIQKYADGTGASIKTDKQDRREAEQLFHQTLAYAAVSKLPKHSVALLNEDGACIRRESYVESDEMFGDGDDTDEAEE